MPAARRFRLAGRWSPQRCTTSRSGQVLAVCLGLLAVFGNPFLVVLAAFLIYAAEMERRHAVAEGQLVENWLRENGRVQFIRSFGEGRIRLLFPQPDPARE